MVSQTNEQALETAIERKLTGTCLEDLKSGEFKTAGPDTAEVAETKVQIVHQMAKARSFPLRCSMEEV